MSVFEWTLMNQNIFYFSNVYGMKCALFREYFVEVLFFEFIVFFTLYLVIRFIMDMNLKFATGLIQWRADQRG